MRIPKQNSSATPNSIPDADSPDYRFCFGCLLVILLGSILTTVFIGTLHCLIANGIISRPMMPDRFPWER